MSILNDLLSVAIDKEYESQIFYQKNSEISTEPLIKDFLENLANQEKEHIQKLNSYLKEITPEPINNTNRLYFKQEKFLYSPEIIKIQSLNQLIEYAISREKKAINYYEKLLSKIEKNKKLNNLIVTLISEEKKHITKIAELSIKFKNEELKILNIKNIILIDLDGTVVATKDCYDGSPPVIRPHFIEFIKNNYTKYIFCIFSQGDYKYIDSIIKYFNLEKYFKFYFDKTYALDGTKNLKYVINKLNLPLDMLKKILIIDDHFSVVPQKNLIKATTFYGDENDDFFREDSIIKKIEDKFDELNS